MGLVYADFTLTNMFTGKSVPIRALVDTGATEAFVTPEVAKQLGFDPGEVRHKPVFLADGRQVDAPCLAPVEIRWADRTYATEVRVLGDECLMGVVPLEVLSLVVDPKRLRLVPDPKHPDEAYARA